MRGDIVAIRTFGGKPLKARVWAVGQKVVYVTNEEQYQLRKAKKRAAKPIGFPKEDVFRITEDQSWNDDTFDWSTLPLWDSFGTPHMFGDCKKTGDQSAPNLWLRAQQLSMFPD